MLSLLSEIVWNKETIMMTLIFGLPIVAVAAGTWYQLNKVRSDNELKQSMIERGMSAEEIERVMNAKGSKDKDD